MTLATSFLQDDEFIQVLYIVAFSLFIIGLRGVTSPKTARRGNVIAAVGMAIAVVATLLIPEVGDYGLIAARRGHRHGDRHPRRPLGADDPDAADGGAVQRRRRRRRGADRLGRVPQVGRRPAAGGGSSPSCSRRSSARSRSGARTSPSASCRRSSPAGRSSCPASSSSTPRCCWWQSAAPWPSPRARSPSCCSSRSWSRRRSSATCSCCPSAGRTCRWSSPC